MRCDTRIQVECSLLRFKVVLFFFNLPGQVMQPFEVPSHAGKIPFSLRLLKATLLEASESHDCLDDPEDRLRRRLA